MKVSVALFELDCLGRTPLMRNKSIGCPAVRPYTKTRFTGIFRRLADEGGTFRFRDDVEVVGTTCCSLSGEIWFEPIHLIAPRPLQRKMQANLVFV